ncbi:hypothetical protein D3C78_1024060 [compost metagenome]
MHHLLHPGLPHHGRVDPVAGQRAQLLGGRHVEQFDLVAADAELAQRHHQPEVGSRAAEETDALAGQIGDRFDAAVPTGDQALAVGILRVDPDDHPVDAPGQSVEEGHAADGGHVDALFPSRGDHRRPGDELDEVRPQASLLEQLQIPGHQQQPVGVRLKTDGHRQRAPLC